MKVTVKRSGGFAGIQMPAKVLEVDDDEILMELGNAAWTSKDDKTDFGMDMMAYEITTEAPGRDPEVMSFTDRTLPPAVQTLVDYVLNKAK